MSFWTYNATCDSVPNLVTLVVVSTSRDAESKLPKLSRSFQDAPRVTSRMLAICLSKAFESKTGNPPAPVGTPFVGDAADATKLSIMADIRLRASIHVQGEFCWIRNSSCV